MREPHEVLRRFRTPGVRRTNQKSIFDIDPSGRWLCTGEEVRFFPTHLERTVSLTPSSIIRLDTSPFLTCKLSQRNLLSGSKHMEARLFRCVETLWHCVELTTTFVPFPHLLDSIGSAVFNPLDASLLTVSGSRHFGASSTFIVGRDSSDDRSDRTSTSSEDSDTGSEMKSVHSEGHSSPTHEDDEGSSDSEAEHPEVMQSRARTVRLAKPSRPFVLDNSAKIWRFDAMVQESPTVSEGDVLATA